MVGVWKRELSAMDEHPKSLWWDMEIEGGRGLDASLGNLKEKSTYLLYVEGRSLYSKTEKFKRPHR